MERSECLHEADSSVTILLAAILALQCREKDVPLLSSTRLVAVDTRDKYFCSLFQAMKRELLPGYAVIRFNSAGELAQKIASRNKRLAYFEIVGHSTPQTCSVWDFTNVNALEKLIKGHTTKSCRIILSGCNTMACTYGANISQKIASETNRTVLGTRGYIEGGSFIYGRVRCSRDNGDPQYSPVYCETVSTTGVKSYAAAHPMDYPRHYRAEFGPSVALDYLNPHISTVSIALFSTVEHTLSARQIYSRRLNPFIGPDLTVTVSNRLYTFFNDFHLMLSVADNIMYVVKSNPRDVSDLRPLYLPFLPTS